MRAHVLITNKETFPVVRDNGFWGLGISGIPTTIEELYRINLSDGRKPYFKMITDMLGTRPGDIVFLYERQVGFHGIYRIVGCPFFDPTPVGIVNETWPIRIEIECVDYFTRPVPEDYLFSSREYESKFWIWFYRKIQGPRGANTINPEGAETLIELLVKVNGNSSNIPDSFRTYHSKNKNNIDLPIKIFEKNGKIILEDILRGWLIKNIDKSNSDIMKIFGPSDDLEWFANNVPYHVTQKNIDILSYHKNNKYTGFPLRYKFSVTEIKKDTANDEDVIQLIEYSKWVAGRLAKSEVEIVQPILIAFDFNKKALLKAINSDFSDRGIKFFKYIVVENDIKFEKVQI